MRVLEDAMEVSSGAELLDALHCPHRFAPAKAVVFSAPRAVEASLL